MLAPRRVKWRRPHKAAHKLKGRTKAGDTLSFGDYGLQALGSAWITDRQIEAARVAITRHIRRGGKLWIKIFPHQAITKKPAETRMGSGKGAPDRWVAVVQTGRIMFELSGVPEDVARSAMRLAAHKLPIRTRFVVRATSGPAVTETGGEAANEG